MIYCELLEICLRQVVFGPLESIDPNDFHRIAKSNVYLFRVALFTSASCIHAFRRSHPQTGSRSYGHGLRRIPEAGSQGQRDVRKLFGTHEESEEAERPTFAEECGGAIPSGVRKRGNRHKFGRF